MMDAYGRQRDSTRYRYLRMSILTADGPSAGQNELWELSEGKVYIIGRADRCDCHVSWDEAVSRRHVEVRVVEKSLSLRCLNQVTHPIWKEGRTFTETTVEPGESFRIGRTWFKWNFGQTRLPIIDFVKEAGSSDGSTTSMLLSPSDIRLSVVSESATELWTTKTDKELAEAGLKILRRALNSAELLVVLSCHNVEAANRPKIVHWHKFSSGVSATVSRELIAKAMQEGTTAVEVDSDALGGPVNDGHWSLCVPIKSNAQ